MGVSSLYHYPVCCISGSIKYLYACFQVLLLIVHTVFSIYYIPKTAYLVAIISSFTLLSALGIPLYYETLFPAFLNNIMSNRKLTICRLQTITQGKPPPHIREMGNDTKKENLANFLSEKN